MQSATLSVPMRQPRQVWLTWTVTVKVILIYIAPNLVKRYNKEKKTFTGTIQQGETLRQ